MPYISPKLLPTHLNPVEALDCYARQGIGDGEVESWRY